jgi:hypothetical protein
MDAEIHAVDTERRESEGNTLTLRGANIEVAVKRYEGLPFGDAKDQQYIELKASSWDGTTRSDLTARLNATDVERLFAVAYAAEMVAAPVNPRVAELVEQLRAELAPGGSPDCSS